MLRRAEPSSQDSEVQLELELFELIDVGASLALLRIVGRWAGIDPGALDVPKLLVDEGEAQHRLLPLAEDRATQAARDEGLWAVSFVASAPGERAARAQYSLDAGVVIDLPRPVRKRLAGGEVLPPADAEPEPEQRPAAAAGPRARPPARVLAAAGVGAALVVAGLAVTLAGSGSDDAPDRPRAAVLGTSARSEPPAERPIALAPVAAAGPAASTARGTLVSSAGGRRTLELRALPAGRYAVWLFDSVIEARRLASVGGPTARVELPPAPELAAFRFVDVSREDDANPNHSGRSILRVPTAQLR